MADFEDAIGGYAIEHAIGEGGLSRVFRARDRAGRVVALKVAREASVETLEAFRREVGTLQYLESTGIVGVPRLIAFGSQSGVPWLALDLIEGTSLDHALHAAGVARLGRGDTARVRPDGASLRFDPVARAGTQHAFLSRRELIPVLRELTATLASLHACGVVHGDVKPHNVLLDVSGSAVLIDLGSSRRTFIDVPEREALSADRTLLATPSYMAPEQTAQVDPRTDIYGFGCILYEVLWGEPYTGHLRARPLLGGWPDAQTVSALQPWLERMLEPEAARRAATLEGLVDQLDALLGRVSAPGTSRLAGWVPFVGRSAEQELLRQKLIELQRGRSAMLGVHGERGAGKTRLLNELASMARGMGCAVVAALDVEQGARVERLLRGEEQARSPMLIVLDDLQRSSWSLQQEVMQLDAQRAVPANVLVVATWSSGGGFPGLSRESCLSLSCLSREAVLAMLRALLQAPISVELLDTAFIQAAGNPARIRQLTERWHRMGALELQHGAYRLTAPSEPIVSQVAQVRAAQLQALSSEARELLLLARLLGPELDAQALAWVTPELDPSVRALALAELIAARALVARDAQGLLVEDRGSAPPELMMDTARLRALSAAYAAGVAASESARNSAAALASLGRLQRSAREPEAAFETYRAAALLAQSERDRFQARVLLRAALQAYEGCAQTAQERLADAAAQCRERLAEALVLAGDHGEADRLFVQVLEPARGLARARLLGRRGHALSQARSYELAERVFDEAASALAAEPDAQLADRIELLLMQFWHSYFSRRRLQELPQLAFALGELAPAHGDPRQRCEYHQCMASLGMFRSGYTQDAETVDHARRGWAILDSEPSLAHRRGLGLFYLGFPLLWAGDAGTWQEAASVLERSLIESGDVEERSAACSAHLYGAVANRRLGQIARVERAAHHALLIAEEIGSPGYRGAALACLCWVAYRRERFESARLLAAQALRQWQGGALRYPFQWLLGFPLAELRALAGEEHAARAALLRLIEPDQHRLPESLRAAIEATRELNEHAALLASLRGIARSAAQHGYL